MQKLQEVITNPIFSIIMAACTILSVILSFFFYFKAKKSKGLVYYIRSNNLVDGKKMPEDVKISYKDKAVDNITITIVGVRNKGKETVNNADISSKQPIQIWNYDAVTKKVLEDSILDIKILQQANSANASLKIVSGGRVNINFDYLDYRDYIEVQIIHASLSNNIYVTGMVKGQGRIKRNKE